MSGSMWGVAANATFAFGGVSYGTLCGMMHRSLEQKYLPPEEDFDKICQENCNKDLGWVTGWKQWQVSTAYPVLTIQSLLPYFFTPKKLTAEDWRVLKKDLATHVFLYTASGLIHLFREHILSFAPISNDVMLKVSAAIMHFNAMNFATNNGTKISKKIVAYGALSAWTDIDMLYNKTKNCNTAFEAIAGAVVAVVASLFFRELANQIAAGKISIVTEEDDPEEEETRSLHES